MPFYIYEDNIPFASNNPSVDQPKMQTNTNSIDSIIAVDHHTFNDNDGGTHKQVQLSATPGINGTVPSGLSGSYQTLYASVTNGAGELWLARGVSNHLQLTGPGVPVATTSGSSFLPGGMVIQWGKISSAFKNVLTSANFSTPFNTTCFAMQGTLRQGTSGSVITLTPTSTTTFDYYINSSSSQTISFFWYAIGN